MSLLERPRLRPSVVAFPKDRERTDYLLLDQLRLCAGELDVTAQEWAWIQLLDGDRSLREVQAEDARQFEGSPVSLDDLRQLVARLDGALFLDSPRFRQHLEGPIRPPCFVHRYETSPGALARVLERLFTGPRGPGLPGEPRPDGRLRAVLVPHMDYDRGGHTYAYAFKEVFERSPAALFVIIGTSHCSHHRFTVTRKHFETPLGIAQTDQEYIDRLVHHYGPGLFDDEVMAHFPEHSIELEVALLQWHYTSRRPFRIVPLVVGSFHDCVRTGREPIEAEDIGRMVRALRAVEEETTEPICYLISGDLAHIGPKFGDRRLVSKTLLGYSKQQDEALLRQAEQADPTKYFRFIAAEGDQRRICGLPPTYTVLQAARPSRGKILAYAQYEDPTGWESVSFASVAFDR